MKCVCRQAEEGLWLALASTREVERAHWPRLCARMDAQRQAACARLRRDEDKALCILADALARQLLAERSGLAPEAVVFARRAGGKPCAPGTGLEFSLSHSGTLVLCAVAAFPVGADLQRGRALSEPLLRWAGRRGYQGHSEADFFRWWVRREAAGKLTGAGLSGPPPDAGLSFLDGHTRRDGAEYYYSVCKNQGFPRPE